MTNYKSKPLYFILIVIILLLLHFGFVAYVQTHYVHLDGPFWRHFLSIHHLMINKKLNRFLTIFIVLSFAKISTVLYSRLYKSKEKISDIHFPLRGKYKILLNYVNSKIPFFSSFLDNLLVSFFVNDKHHKVLLWNKACENLRGIKRVDVLGTDNHWKRFIEITRPLLADLALTKDIHNYSKFTIGFTIPILLKMLSVQIGILKIQVARSLT